MHRYWLSIVQRLCGVHSRLGFLGCWAVTRFPAEFKPYLRIGLRWPHLCCLWTESILNQLSNHEVLHKNTGLFRFSHFCAPQINAAVSCDLTRRGGEALYKYRQSGPLQPIEHRRWSPEMSAPQHIGVRAPTGRLSGVREQTCRLPSKLSLGSRQVGCLAFGSRPVGSPANCRWGADRSVPQNIAVGGPTCRLPRHCLKTNENKIKTKWDNKNNKNVAHKSQCCKYMLTEPHAPTMHVTHTPSTADAFSGRNNWRVPTNSKTHLFPGLSFSGTHSPIPPHQQLR